MLGGQQCRLLRRGITGGELLEGADRERGRKVRDAAGDVSGEPAAAARQPFRVFCRPSGVNGFLTMEMSSTQDCYLPDLVRNTWVPMITTIGITSGVLQV